MWNSGYFFDLLTQHLKAMESSAHPRRRKDRAQGRPEDDSILPDGPRRLVLEAVKEGEIGKACRVLDAVWCEVDPMCFEENQPLFIHMQIHHRFLHVGKHTSERTFHPKRLRRPCAAPQGIKWWAWRFDACAPAWARGRQAEVPSGPGTIDVFLCLELAPSLGGLSYLGGVNLVALLKADTGLRPIDVGSCSAASRERSLWLPGRY